MNNYDYMFQIIIPEIDKEIETEKFGEKTLDNIEFGEIVKNWETMQDYINLNKQNEIINKLDFSLTNDQSKALDEINNDLCSSSKMFRLLQGDVGSGKTIISLLAALNTINSYGVKTKSILDDSNEIRECINLISIINKENPD